VVTPAADEKWTKEEQAVWEQTIEDQRHFNGLIIQSRTITNSAYAAITALAIGLSALPDGFLVGGTIMVALAAFMWAMRQIDAYYWELLIAAVEFGEKLERRSGLKPVQEKSAITDPGHPETKSDIVAYGPTDYIHQRVNPIWARKSIRRYDNVLLSFSIILAAVLFILASHFYFSNWPINLMSSAVS
jgi:hypothetical protein